MKPLLLLACLCSFHAFSQQFRVSPDFYDSTGVAAYDFHVTGYANFNDSMVVEVEMRSSDSLNTVLFSGFYSFADSVSSTLAGFTYDPVTTVFYCPLGMYVSKEMDMWVRSVVNGETREVLLIAGFDDLIGEYENQ